jgi:hypothetical protein
MISTGLTKLFASKEKLNWLTGGLGQKKEVILESGLFAEIPYDRKGYKCSNCRAFIIGTQEDSDSNNKIKHKTEFSNDKEHYHASNYP